MKKLLLLFLLPCLTALYAQELTLPVKYLSDAKALPERFVGTDAFGWQYTIADNEFHKAKGKQLLKYKNVALGEIYKVDLQNPLQIVLFYKKQNTVVLLDNQLNETSRINFSITNGTRQELVAEAVGLASQNRLWVYDILTQKTGLYDIIQGTYRALTPAFNDGISDYTSDYNYFYWTDNNNLCRRVTVFGHVQELGTVPAFDSAQVISAEKMLYSKGNLLYVYDFATATSRQIDLNEKSYTGFYYAAQILTIFTGTQIISYAINLP